MIIQKFAHSCFTVTVDEKSIVIDPGNFTNNFIMPQKVIGVIITHQHSDHYNPDILDEIRSKFPDIDIFTTEDMLMETKTTIISDSLRANIGPFNLEFFYGNHAQIDQSIAQIKNAGILINERLYYPGDSFTLPNRPVEILALPVAAPWLKISETLNFLRDIRPKIAFPVHDEILSSNGKNLVDKLCQNVANELNCRYERFDKKLF